MITFPCCKINLGLNIVAKRPDGYHELETVFYPVPLCDALEIKKMDNEFPSPTPIDLKVTGNAVECDERKNLVVKAYHLLAQDYKLPRLHAHLVKRIPMQAGLGGGSADAAYMIRLLDERFRLNMGNAEMERYAAQLGADCAFFIRSETAYATGIGEILAPVDNDENNLEGYYLALVKPDVAVSTAEAFAGITPKKPVKNCRDIVRQPIDTWRTELTNDFEQTIFAIHPILATIKEKLYKNGALYAQMSGSGSTIFGIFGQKPKNLDDLFPDMFTYCVRL
ncbi:4-(cytidine 5'-diphospho)-2-C-methyl-D-erythritol kinase [Prevotella scopos JCM 17725]|uniref:4-diphosphocytidyl-2-C-methyl-D-erythritol kinase n=1 Tax=Prevotella scopos JCM 17725 TaxID=1236518 RepID=A0AAX2F0T7_9BACT|nr:4-(cytidine 5'-diphospho)-2-C-methyl-D-erythritol kinase [Prevotella scopos]ANR74180.1 4-(cytidine 5'-diphospho)-2-C-methyl-D-erythritol kinase [Prevotella scopos JCM 17725]QUB44772.1 4-(cytidine 5'-diphospho)-2-C-methyl-D-erythritol kinase [Prevotella scopos JCM 17725]SHF58039.1 4-diphosphocytidyl-2-C-methyl-D-erythritol kinase [Prevotella scopos JCM 17725]